MILRGVDWRMEAAARLGIGGTGGAFIAMSASAYPQQSFGPAVTTAEAVGLGYGGAAVTTAGAAGLAQIDPMGSRGAGLAAAGAGVLTAEVKTSGGGALAAGMPSQSAGVHLRCLAAPAFVIAGAEVQGVGRRTAGRRGTDATERGLLGQDSCGRLCMYLLMAAAADLRWVSQGMLNLVSLGCSDSGDDDDDDDDLSTTLSIPPPSPAVVTASLALPGQRSIV